MKSGAVVFGSVLWDIIEGKEYIGGAPFNLAAHLSLLGIDSLFISRVGKDQRGENALKEMAKIGISTKSVQVDPMAQTGFVEVSFSNDGSPSYYLPENVAYDNIDYVEIQRSITKSGMIDVFCFGTFDQRTAKNRESLGKYLDQTDSKHIFCDINLRQPHYSREIILESLMRATIAKMNENEEAEICSLLYGKWLEEGDFLKRLSRDFDIRTIIVTKGPRGCTISEGEGIWSLPGIEVKTVDTIGAGDAFSAAFLWCYIKSNDPLKSAKYGNILGSYVASRQGALPEYSREVKTVFELE